MIAIEKNAESVVAAMRAYIGSAVGKLIAPLKDALAAIERRVDAMPAPIQGERGQPGEKGIAGDRGDVGERGEKGMPGDKGEAGVPGERGEPGPHGEKGEPGERGEKGEPGERGELGGRGDVGERGEKGEAGAHGTAGLPGERGERGLQGDPGKSAFLVAKESGFVGSEGEWLLSLKGRDGGRGERGSPGENGRPGDRGDDGDHGRDALELSNILDGIDETRSYSKGTSVAMLGGTFWATRKTDALGEGGDFRDAGWVCIARGVAAETEVVEDGGRWLVRTTDYSDGSQKQFRHKTATPIDRGVYGSAKAYDAGDVVTYGGSAFIAQRDTKTAPGGDDWRLAVKRGKDGKDLT